MSEPTEFVRSMPFTVERSAEDGDGLTMSGYAAVFNQPARINDWEGEFDEVILPGAFADTLRNQTPTLLFDHGHHPLIGSIPIGKYTDIREDAHGLHVEARLHNNWLTEPIRDAIKERSVTGMSFRFLSNGTKDTWTDRKGDVPLREISSTVVPEMGPVVFPAYAGTEVGVRSYTIKVEADRADWANADVRDQVVMPVPRKSDRDSVITVDPEELADAYEAVANEDLTGQPDTRSADGSDAVTPQQAARTRALKLRKI